MIGVGVFIFNVCITPVSAQNVPTVTESAESVLQKSLDIDHSTTKVERSTLELYAGMFFTDNSATSSLEVVSKTNHFSHLTNKKTKSVTHRDYGSAYVFINGVEVPESAYYDTITQLVKNRKVVEYVSIFPFNKTQKTETDYLDKKYKEAEFSDALRKKIMNKLIATGYIKLNAQESKDGLYYSLDLGENDKIMMERSMNAIADILLTAPKGSLKIVEDKGMETLTYEYSANPYSTKKSTKVVEARKLVLSFDVDQLSKSIVGTSKVKDLTFDFQDEKSTLADVTSEMKTFYSNLTFEVWIDSKTYSVYKIYVPTYQFSFSKDGKSVELPVEIRFEYASTGSKDIPIPKKYITPTQIKAMYGKR